MIGESPAHSKTCSLRNRLLSPQSPPSELRAPTLYVWTLQQVNRFISVNQTGWYYVLFGIDFQIPKGFNKAASRFGSCKIVLNKTSSF